jgi:hypothetical protein
MANIADSSARTASSHYAYFQTLFETADVTSFFWQPVLTSVGRTQLELVGLQARQAQAVVHWVHEIAQPASPLALIDANFRLMVTMIEELVHGAPKIAAAINSAADSVAPVVPMPVRKSRDTLVLLDRREESREPERKVA